MNAWTGDVKATVGAFSVHSVEYTRYQSTACKREKILTLPESSSNFKHGFLDEVYRDSSSKGAGK